MMDDLIRDATELWYKVCAHPAVFTATPQSNRNGEAYLLLMADLSGLGRKGSMNVRVHRLIYPRHADDNLEAEIAALYADLEVAIRRSQMIGVRI